jgi:hypothetical protein
LEISPALVETLITLAVGAVLGASIGFVSSIGLETWKENNDRKELKSHVKEDLQIVKQEIESYIRKDENVGHAFFIDVYLNLKPELIRKLNVKTSQSIMKTWIEIGSLGLPLNDRAMRIKKYQEALDSINETLRLLG